MVCGYGDGLVRDCGLKGHIPNEGIEVRRVKGERKGGILQEG
jgi:hypothetical protein